MPTRIAYMEYDENVGKKNVQLNLDNMVRDESLCIGELGLPSAIKWEDKEVYKDRISARQYLDKNSKGKPLAVKYRVPMGLLKTPAIERKEKKLADMILRKDRYIVSHSMTKTKTQYFTCKNCGSRIATKYMRGNNCRVCGAEARSDDVLKKIKEMEEDCEKFKNEIDGILEELRSGSHGRWLLRIEYEVPEEVA